MLDHLHGDEAAERAVRQGRQVFERVSLRCLQPALTTDLDHRDIQIEAASLDAVLAHEIQELAAAAADVEHVGRTGKVRHVELQAGANLLF